MYIFPREHEIKFFIIPQITIKKKFNTGIGPNITVLRYVVKSLQRRIPYLKLEHI